MSATQVTTYARPGQTTHRAPQDVTVNGLTVNGSAATISSANGLTTISAPALVGGEKLVWSYTRLAPPADRSSYQATFTA